MASRIDSKQYYYYIDEPGEPEQFYNDVEPIEYIDEIPPSREDEEMRQLMRVGAYFVTGMAIALFLCIGVGIGYLFYNSVRHSIASWDDSEPYYSNFSFNVEDNPESLFPIIDLITVRGGDLPTTGTTGALLPDYQKKERINILLLGIDKRPDERFARSDTMILVTIDPENYEAGMVSIPRDLYLQIPGHDQTRINKAHYYGEQENQADGGPALAMKTIEQNFGIPIHFYVKVDFNGFREVVDTIGGIDIDVPITIHDPTFPDNHYGYDPFYIERGQHHMDGALALKYARTRKAPGSDFGRAERQQQVLLAIKEKALSLNIIPKIPELWVSMSNNIQTDLKLNDIIELVEIAPKITIDQVSMTVLGDEYTDDYVTHQGAMVLLPKWEKIDAVVADMFAEVKANPPTQAEINAQEAAKAALEAERQAQENERNAFKQQINNESATIIIQNGTDNADIEVEVAQFLADQGFEVLYFGPADLANYEHTVIVSYSHKEYTLGTLTKFFNVVPENVRNSPVSNGQADIRVIIGEDFKMADVLAQIK